MRPATPAVAASAMASVIVARVAPQTGSLEAASPGQNLGSITVDVSSGFVSSALIFFATGTLTADEIVVVMDELGEGVAVGDTPGFGVEVVAATRVGVVVTVVVAAALASGVEVGVALDEAIVVEVEVTVVVANAPTMGVAVGVEIVEAVVVEVEVGVALAVGAVKVGVAFNAVVVASVTDNAVAPDVVAAGVADNAGTSLEEGAGVEEGIGI